MPGLLVPILIGKALTGDQYVRFRHLTDAGYDDETVAINLHKVTISTGWRTAIPAAMLIKQLLSGLIRSNVSHVFIQVNMCDYLRLYCA